jgi:hypothetical protein
MNVFQTANSVLVVSAVVAVVISFVAAPPLVRLQPPKVYPALVVAAVLESDSVDTLSESEEIRVELSVSGTAVARVFPSKTIVGLDAVVASAADGIATKLKAIRRDTVTIEISLCESDKTLEFTIVAIGFP